MQRKHTLVFALVVALVLSSLGVVAAQEDGGAAWLGVAVSDDTADGARVETVMDESPAAEAGIREGDVITAVDDTAIEGAEHLVDVIAGYAPGDTVTLAVLRDAEELGLDVTLGERPADLGAMAEPEFDIQVPPMMGRMDMFGLDLEMTDDGLRVTAIDAGSPLAEAGLQEGDLIVEVNGAALADLLPRDVMLALGEGELTLTVLRDGEEVTLTLDVAGLLDDMPVPFMFPQPGDAPRPAQLGVRFATLDAELAAEEGLEVEEGALIREVYDDTPAAEAGLQAGDVITAVDGDIVDEERTLADRLYAYEAGDVVTLSVLRDGAEIEVDVTLGPRNAPQSFSFRDMPFSGRGRGMQSFGHGRGMHFFGPEFFELHPFLGERFENMPEPAPDAEGEAEVAPDTSGTSA